MYLPRLSSSTSPASRRMDRWCETVAPLLWKCAVISPAGSGPPRSSRRISRRVGSESALKLCWNPNASPRFDICLNDTPPKPVCQAHFDNCQNISVRKPFGAGKAIPSPTSRYRYGMPKMEHLPLRKAVFSTDVTASFLFHWEDKKEPAGVRSGSFDLRDFIRLLY